MRSPSGVPPGSRVCVTARPVARMVSAALSSAVDLPAPSVPSKVIRRPRDSATFATELKAPHSLVVFLDGRRELMGAVAPGNEIQRVARIRMYRGQQ